MLECSGHLHEDSGVYETQDRTKVGFREGGFLSHRWAWGMVMEEELEVER